MNLDARVARFPSPTYQQLVTERATGRWGALAGRVLTALAAIGVGVAITTTGRTSIALVATIAASWSFALLVQGVAAAAIILPASNRPVSTLRAFELWCLAHVPWSLWLVATPAIPLISGRDLATGGLLASALVPAVWTGFLLRAFCRTVLRARRPGLAMAVHQSVLWGLTLCYIAFAIGGWDRVLAEIGL